MSALASLTQNYSDSEDSNCSDDGNASSVKNQPVDLQTNDSTNQEQLNSESKDQSIKDENDCHSRPSETKLEEKNNRLNLKTNDQDSTLLSDIHFNRSQLKIESDGVLQNGFAKDVDHNFYTQDDELYVPNEEQESDEHSEDEIHNLRETLIRQCELKKKLQEEQIAKEEPDSNLSSENKYNCSNEDPNQRISRDEPVDEITSPPLSPISFHRSLIDLPIDQVRIPDAPNGVQCSEELLEKLNRLHQLMKEGRDMNAFIQKKKSFRNPSIYEKLIAYCDIDEFGSNFPPECYDPHCWKETDFYRHLSKQQREEMKKREQERKERAKVETITIKECKRTVSSANSNGKIASNDATNEKPARKKSKWDIPASMASSTIKGNVGTLIDPEVIRQKVEKAAATIQSFYK